MNEIKCGNCVKFKTQYCPCSVDCMATDDYPYFQDKRMMLEENQQLKEQNELEFNDFIKFKKEQEDRHLEEKDKLIKENYHLRKQLQQRDEVIDEILNTSYFDGDCPYSIIGDGWIEKLCDCNNCKDNYKECRLKYFKYKGE